MNIYAKQMSGKPGQKSSEAATASETAQHAKLVRSTADARRIPAWAMAWGDALPPGLVLQTKLSVSQPGDTYEQEADRISEQVMRTTEPQLQRACTCGGECPKCQTEEPDREHERVQAKRIQS